MTHDMPESHMTAGRSGLSNTDRALRLADLKGSALALVRATPLLDEGDVADDLCSRVLHEANEKHLLDLPEADWRRWSITRLKQRLIDDIRRKKIQAKDGDAALDMLPSPRLSPSEELDRAELLGCLRKALGSLTEWERTCIYSFYFLGMSYREIAEEDGRTEAAAKQAAFEARKKLRPFLEDYGERR